MAMSNGEKGGRGGGRGGGLGVVTGRLPSAGTRTPASTCLETSHNTDHIRFQAERRSRLQREEPAGFSCEVVDFREVHHLMRLKDVAKFKADKPELTHVEIGGVGLRFQGRLPHLMKETSAGEGGDELNPHSVDVSSVKRLKCRAAASVLGLR